MGCSKEWKELRRTSHVCNRKRIEAHHCSKIHRNRFISSASRIRVPEGLRHQIKISVPILARITHQRVRRDRIIQFQQSKRAGIGDDEQTPPNSEIGQPHAGLINLLSSGRQDPFQSYAVQLTPREQLLLDHCKLYSPSSRSLAECPMVP